MPKEQREYREWDQVFSAHRNPVYWLPTVRMNHRTTEEELDQWVAAIDQIVGSRSLAERRKGIIHTVSYSRQRYLLERSKYSQYFMANSSDPDSETAREVMIRFKASKEPVALVSPSFSTGWDFPDDDCRWQIITKIAFPDTRSKIVQARKQKSDNYINSIAAQDLLQAVGRARRHELDWCENFIVDDSIEWFMRMCKISLPTSFRVHRVNSLPSPMRLAA
jgi:Rad3-related DNA helicase